MDSKKKILERIAEATERVSRLTTAQRRQMLADELNRVGPPDDTWPEVITGITPEALHAAQTAVRSRREKECKEHKSEID